MLSNVVLGGTTRWPLGFRCAPEPPLGSWLLLPNCGTAAPDTSRRSLPFQPAGSSVTPLPINDPRGYLLVNPASTTNVLPVM